MADKKISELTTASEIKNGDNLELSQDTGSGLVSLKATILAIATKILTAINFTSALTTTDKTVIGAINEIAQGGGGGGASTEIIADDFDATSTYAVGDYVVYDGKLYKCTTAVSTAGQWDANDWTETIVMDEVEQGGGGGTTVIANPSGTATADLEKLQVGNNIYSIPSGGTGGGGDIRIKDRNWTLITSSYGTTQLTDNYDYYLWVVICDSKINYYKIIDSTLLNLETNESAIIDYATWNDGAGAYSNSRFTLTSTNITLWDNAQSAVTQKVYGANAKSGGEVTIEQGQTISTDTATASVTSGKYYLFATCNDGSNFSGANIIVGNTSVIYSSSGIGRAGCIIKATSNIVTYNRYGGSASNLYVELDITDDKDLVGIGDSWLNGTSITTEEKKFYFLVLGAGETGDVVGANVLVEEELTGTFANGTRYLIVKSTSTSISLDNNHSFYYRRIEVI